MRVWAALAAVVLVGTVVACSDQPGESDQEPVVPTPAASSAPVETPAAPNYDEREGDLYMYVAGLSDEERKVGKAAGDVILFRYLGERGGVHRLENVTAGGARVDVSECAVPCKVIKVIRRDGTTDRIGYSPNSIIGSAFEDAFEGRLVAVKEATKTPQTSNIPATGQQGIRIPAAFAGEWNANIQHCGTGLDDSRLRVEPKRLRFYESDAEVSGVTIRNARAVQVEASFSGEGQTWTDKVEMVLSRSGTDLTIDGFTRHRCPN